MSCPHVQPTHDSGFWGQEVPVMHDQRYPPFVQFLHQNIYQFSIFHAQQPPSSKPVFFFSQNEHKTTFVS